MIFYKKIYLCALCVSVVNISSSQPLRYNNGVIRHQDNILFYLFPGNKFFIIETELYFFSALPADNQYVFCVLSALLTMVQFFSAVMC